MAMPEGIGAIDLMMAIPRGKPDEVYSYLNVQMRDAESRSFEFPAEYMFKDVPAFDDLSDPVAVVLREMDRHGVARSMIAFHPDNEWSVKALREHPDRFFGSWEVNPNRGMEEVRDLERMHREYGIKAATAFPSGCNPPVPINDKRFYPIYAKCIELDIPICVCAGFPGPRLPMAAQHVELIDEVCWFFPELRFVTRHGCEPWADLAVKLLLKWPNLYYSTSAFAPRYYPKAVIDFANTRGADKVMYAGYFPMALSLERIFSEMRHVPFRDHVWPKFLRDNAVRVFKLDE